MIYSPSDTFAAQENPSDSVIKDASHSPDDSHAGILKRPGGLVHKRKAPESRSIAWDEDNLILNEAQRTATMKIDEPKTPYNYLSMSEDGSESENEVSLAVGAVSPSALLERLNDGSPISPRRLSFSTDDDDDDDVDDEETRAKHAEFARRRAAHYDMASALKMKPDEFDDDDDEDEDDDDDNIANDNKGDNSKNSCNSTGNSVPRLDEEKDESDVLDADERLQM